VWLQGGQQCDVCGCKGGSNATCVAARGAATWPMWVGEGRVTCAATSEAAMWPCCKAHGNAVCVAVSGAICAGSGDVVYAAARGW
jgi:hypothetical protein